LNPNLASAFANRGDAFARQGDHVRAIQDYNAALELRSNDARLVRLRGRVQFNHGDFQAAVPDFAAAAALEPHRYDHLLFLYLAQVRAGQDGRAELARQAEHQSLGAWPGPVVSLYLGQLTPDAVLLEAVASTPDAKVQRERPCQA
jgi:lipoprotein NlpI